MADNQTQDQTNEATRRQAVATNDAPSSLPHSEGQAKAEPFGPRGENPSTAGPGSGSHVHSTTPENASKQLDPSSPGETGTTPGTNTAR